jgi:hypothetical protein
MNVAPSHCCASIFQQCPLAAFALNVIIDPVVAQQRELLDAIVAQQWVLNTNLIVTQQ